MADPRTRHRRSDRAERRGAARPRRRAVRRLVRPAWWRIAGSGSRLLRLLDPCARNRLVLHRHAADHTVDHDAPANHALILRAAGTPTRQRLARCLPTITEGAHSGVHTTGYPFTQRGYSGRGSTPAWSTAAGGQIPQVSPPVSPGPSRVSLVKDLILQAGGDLVTRLARERDPIRAVVELAWNSIDGEADNVRVLFRRSDLDAVEAVIVEDDGHA